MCHSGDIVIIQKEGYLLCSASTVSVLRAPVLSSVHVRLFPVEILLSLFGGSFVDRASLREVFEKSVRTFIGMKSQHNLRRRQPQPNFSVSFQL